MTDEEIARIVAENLPTPYAIDVCSRTTAAGPVFDLSQADADSREQWLGLVSALRKAFAEGKP